MATSFEEAVDAYYSNKEKYTESLHKAANDLPQEAASSEKHTPTVGLENWGSWGTWFTQTKEEIAEREELNKQTEDLLNRLRASRAAQKQSEEAESKMEAASKVKSKGKKK